MTQRLPVSPDSFRRRLTRGVLAEKRALQYLEQLGHQIKPLGLATSLTLDFTDRNRHRTHDLECVRCGQSFEVRSSRVGMTMGHSQRRPFWDGKRLSTLVVHIALELKSGAITSVTIGDLIQTMGQAELKFDAERSHPYLFWSSQTMHTIKREIRHCPKDGEQLELL